MVERQTVGPKTLSGPPDAKADSTDRLLPIRAKEATDKVLPRMQKSKTEVVSTVSTQAAPSTDRDDPNEAAARTDIVDPREDASNMDRLLERIAADLTVREPETASALRTDKELPNRVFSLTERDPVKILLDPEEKTEPINSAPDCEAVEAKASDTMEALAERSSAKTDSPDPIRVLARTDKEDPSVVLP